LHNDGYIIQSYILGIPLDVNLLNSKFTKGFGNSLLTSWNQFLSLSINASSVHMDLNSFSWLSFPPGFLSDENSSYTCFSYIFVPQNQYFARERIVETIQQWISKTLSVVTSLELTLFRWRLFQKCIVCPQFDIFLCLDIFMIEITVPKQ
jgi:hypothetical protein